MPVESLRLEEVAQVVRGVSFDKADVSAEPLVGTVPILRAGNISDVLDTSSDLIWVPSERVKQEQRLRAGDIAICMSSGSQSVVGKSAPLVREWTGSVGAFCAIVRPRPERVEPAYLAHYMRSDGFRTWTRRSEGANIKNIRHSELLRHSVPVPSLAEQRRIVDLLSRAENVVRLRREAESKAKEVIPALFLDSFGNPVNNERNWDVEPLTAVGTLDRGRSRHRPRDAASLYGGIYPFVQTGDVARSGGIISDYEQTYSDVGLAQSKLWPAGTLCITIAANIAETGILQFDACFPDSIVGFLPGPRVRTEYIQYWLGFLRPTLAAQAPQAAQKNINLAILRGLCLPIPPRSMQDAFASRVEKIRSIRSAQSLALRGAEQTLDTLLSNEFRN